MKKILPFLLLVGSAYLPATGQVNFQDMAPQLNVANLGNNYSLAWGDYNNDGREDLIVCSQLQAIILYQQQADGTFLDATEMAGIDDYPTMYSMSVWGDINNDGWLDLFVSNQTDDNALYLNKGDGTFAEIGYNAGVYQGNKVRAALFADVDQDGFLDLYLARLNKENILYKNNGDLTFTDITLESGTTDNQISMGAVFFDYDNDGDLDLYLTHDADQANILYQNDGSGHFMDVSVSSGANVAHQGMGVDFGDINNDGWLDLYITNLYENTLLLNNGDGTFADISESAGIMDYGMGWGTTFLDYNNDGWQDIYVANDSYFSPYPNLLYQNMGDNSFQIVSEGTPLQSMGGSYGVATCDVNQDGLIDLFVSNRGGILGNQLLINQDAAANHWAEIKLEGTLSNRSAIGARVQLVCGDQRFTDEVTGGSGFVSQNSLILHFGLGENEIIDQAVVRWPNGLEETYDLLEVNRIYSIKEGQGITNITTSLGGPEEPVLAQLSIYPNPFSENLAIRFAGKPLVQRITLYDSFGHQVFTKEINQVLQEWSLENSELPQGLLLLQISTDQGIFTKKVLQIRAK